MGPQHCSAKRSSSQLLPTSFSYRLVLVVAIVIASWCSSGSLALRCHFLVEDLHSVNTTHSHAEHTGNSSVHGHDCPSEDKHCVTLVGVLPASDHQSNLTFSFKSCESKVKSYVAPISAKLGQKLHYSCAENQPGLKHNAGPLTYWVECCNSDLCNFAPHLHTAFATIFTLAATVMLLSTTLIFQ